MDGSRFFLRGQSNKTNTGNSRIKREGVKKIGRPKKERPDVEIEESTLFRYIKVLGNIMVRYCPWIISNSEHLCSLKILPRKFSHSTRLLWHPLTVKLYNIR